MTDPVKGVAIGFYDPMGVVKRTSKGPPEQMLWRAVITRAFLDACWVDPRPNDPINNRHREAVRRVMTAEQMRARAWLRGNSRDFFDVCFLADVDPDCVRDMTARCEREGWPQIRESDDGQALALEQAA